MVRVEVRGDVGFAVLACQWPVTSCQNKTASQVCTTAVCAKRYLNCIESKLLHLQDITQNSNWPSTRNRMPHPADVHSFPDQYGCAACGMLLALHSRPTGKDNATWLALLQQSVRPKNCTNAPQIQLLAAVHGQADSKACAGLTAKPQHGLESHPP